MEQIGTENGGARVVLFFVPTGGQGKTSLVRDIGYLLAQRGSRVLIIDPHPQPSFPVWLGGEEGTGDPAEPLRLTVAGTSLDVFCVHTVATGLPGFAAALFREASFVAPRYSSRYDFILIDTPSYPYSLKLVPYEVADLLVVPAETSPKGTWAVDRLLNEFEDLEIGTSALQEIGGYRSSARRELLIVPNRHDPDHEVDRRMVGELTERARPYLLAPPIPAARPIFEEALVRRIPVPVLAPRTLVARRLRSIAEMVAAA